MKLRFTEKRQETDGVWSYFFESLDKITWLAGQSIRLELPRPTWGYDERRFTIASAPYEKHLQITTRESGSNFKHLLETIKPQQEINAYNIEGSFVWDATGPKLGIAGGIGITPFRSLVLDAAHNNSFDDVILLHSGSDRSAIFQSEFEQTAQDFPDFSYQNFSQRIDAELLQKHTPDFTKRAIYLSGAPAMINELTAMLREIGVKNEQIFTDIFTGNLSPKA